VVGTKPLSIGLASPCERDFAHANWYPIGIYLRVELLRNGDVAGLRARAFGCGAASHW